MPEGLFHKGIDVACYKMRRQRMLQHMWVPLGWLKLGCLARCGICATIWPPGILKSCPKARPSSERHGCATLSGLACPDLPFGLIMQD